MLHLAWITSGVGRFLYFVPFQNKTALDSLDPNDEIVLKLSTSVLNIIM